MKTEMKCDDASSHLPLFVGGDLEAPLAESLSGHLLRCEPCSRRLEALERARGALISTRRTELADGSPVDLWAGIRSQLASEGLLDRGTRPVRFPVSSAATSAPLRPDLQPGAQRRPLLSQRTFGGLAAAAALILLVWSPWNERSVRDEGVLPSPPNATAPVGADGLVATQAPLPEVLLISNEPDEGGLRRALPGDERLADSARPFPGLLPLGARGDTRHGEVLVGDKRLR